MARVNPPPAAAYNAPTMAKLLYIQASPRGQRSKSIRVADAFVEAYRQGHGDDEIDTLNLFAADLPTFDGDILNAKYAILHGQQATDDQRKAWRSVEQVIERFAAADKYLFAVPMWNFGIPYRLKHYINVLVQPGYTFSYDPQQGYRGLLTGARPPSCTPAAATTPRPSWPGSTCRSLTWS